MAKGQATPKEIKDLIIQRVVAGEKVDDLATEFNLYPNTIRKWLQQSGIKLSGNSSGRKRQTSEALEISKLKRQNQDLLTIIGEITVINKELAKKKSSKNTNH